MLPPELVSLILSFQPDRPTLLACSLVARSFLYTSRAILFRSTSIALSSSSVASFVGLLLSEECTIRSSIRVVELNDLGRLCRQYGLDDALAAVRKFARQAIPRLSNAKSLEITNTDFEHVPEYLTRALFPPSSTVFRLLTSLTLSNLHFARFSDVVNLISTFADGLEEITIDKVSWTYPSRPGNVLRAPEGVSWSIRDVRRSNLGDLAEWLNRPWNMEVVDLFYDVACEDAGVESAARQLFTKTKGSLKHLQVNFPVFSDAGRVEELLQNFILLDGCTSLQRFSLSQILLFPDADPVTRLIRPLVPRLLAQVAKSTLLDTISFELMLPTTAHLDLEHCLKEFDWKGVVDVLATIPQVRTVEFKIGRPLGKSIEVAQDFIGRMTSKLDVAVQVHPGGV